MSRTNEFIAHGLLPFVGRESEMERILSFWRSIPDAQHLRVMLLVAEAGVGKSRLLEEVLQAVRSERGAVVHVKLYPEAANTLPALVSRSLWSSPSGRDILRNRPGENLHDVTVALQRLSRLRPTLLVLEDVHLFPSESIPDLITLFEGLVDETISVLCLSRPATIGALGILERYLIDSITMEGLGEQALEILWRELFGSEPPNGAVKSLLDTTKGNPLAVRSGLRGAVQNGAILHDRRSGEWRLAVTVAEFAQGLRRNVSLVVEGMVAHLERAHRGMAESLATLGEVFARETADMLAPEVAEIIPVLMEQGIIVETIHPVAPLCGMPLNEPGSGWRVTFPASDRPLLAFTHSLLHSYLSERARIDTAALIAVVAHNAPLYSLRPLHLLGSADIPDETDPEELILVIRRVSAIAQILDRSANWQKAVDLLHPLFHIIDRLDTIPAASAEARIRWRTYLQHVWLSIMRRSISSAEWRAMHDRQLELSSDHDAVHTAQYHILALSFLIERIGIDMPYEKGRESLQRFDELSERFPELRSDRSYVYLLESLLDKAYARSDMETVREVRHRAESILSIADLREDTYQIAVTRILPRLLKFFDSPEELHERHAFVEMIEEFHIETEPYYGTSKLQFLAMTGRFEEVYRLAELVMMRARERGLEMNLFLADLWRVVSGAGLGMAPETLEKGTRAELDLLTRGQNLDECLANAENGLAFVGLLLNKPDPAIESIGRLGREQTTTRAITYRLLLDVWKGNPETFEAFSGGPVPAVNNTNISETVIRAWQAALSMLKAGTEASTAEAIEVLLPALDRPMLHIGDLLTPLGTYLLWKARSPAVLPDELRERLISAAEERIRWLGERHIPAYIAPLLELLELLEAGPRARHLRKELGKAATAPKDRSEEPTEHTTIRISMLGTIRVAIPPDDFAPIRGVRIRTLLGLMVADRMIGTPLSAREFLAIAGGTESDPEHARKKKNMAVVRLREILGHEAIITEGSTPQLNPSLVTVDLLEIDERIRSAREAVRQDAFVRALRLIGEALTLYSGDVPFPTLYEDFFEAARADFEFRLRQAIVETGRGMLNMGDGTGAEPLLRTAFEALPDDEEIGDLLREALETTGNRLEAERIRMRTAGAA